MAAGRHESLCGGATEERNLGRYSCVTGHRSHVGGGFDAEHRHAGSQEMLQEITVVAGNLDDEAVGAEAILAD